MKSQFHSPLSICLEVPLNKREAKRRGIDLRLSRLLITAKSELLYDFIFRCCPTNSNIFAYPEGLFNSIDFFIDKFKKLGILIENDLYRFNNKDQINFVLDKLEAEAFILFFSETQDKALSIINKLPKMSPNFWILSREGYGAPFLKQINVIDPFFFFSQTRSSLEILGHEESVLRCFSFLKPQGGINETL